MGGLLLFCYEPLTGPDFILSPNASFKVWSNGDFDPCFEYLALDIPLYGLFGVASFLYAIRLHTTASRKRRPVHLLVRMLLSALAFLVALGELIGSFKMVEERTISILVSQIVRMVAWTMNIACVYQLSRSVKHCGHGPIFLNLIWYLSLVGLILHFRSVIRWTLYPAAYAYDVYFKMSPYFEGLIRISVCAQLAIQTLYAVTLLFSADLVTGDNVFITTGRSHSGQHLLRTETLQESEREPLLRDSSLVLQEEGEGSSVLHHGGHQLGSRAQRAGHKLDELQVSSQDKAGFFSKLVFWWINPLMRRGGLGLLEEPSDLPLLPSHLTTSSVREQFTRASNVRTSWWQSLRSKCFCLLPLTREEPIPGSNPEGHIQNVSLLTIFNRAFGCHYYPLGVLKLTSDSLGFAGPLLLNALINFMENKDVS